MNAIEFLREGRLQEALAGLQTEVRSDPANPKHRVFLFQLLAIMGQWDRAAQQLKVLGELDPSALPIVQLYREAIEGEKSRQDVFSGQQSPLIFGEPPEWVAFFVEALRLEAGDQFQEAHALREKALEYLPDVSGSLDEQSFEWIADGDSRLGFLLEVIIGGRYYWVPFQRIRSIRIEKPSDLRDVVWMPARFTWQNGGESGGLIPTRYPGTETGKDPALCLAKKTDWWETPAGDYHGIGQRVLMSDHTEYPLMDIRRMDLEVSLGTTEEH